MNIIPQLLVHELQHARVLLGDDVVRHVGEGDISLRRYVWPRSLDVQVSRLMVGPSILSIPAGVRSRDPEIVAMYVPCLGLSLVNLTDRFFSLGLPRGWNWHPKSSIPVVQQ